MKFISHRGYWKTSGEKNSQDAFRRSFNLGFGTETDIRDCAGELVISHDIPNGTEMTVDTFFQIFNETKCPGSLALNIKSDGLQKPLIDLILKYQIDNYFLFDMSVPDAVVSFKDGLKTYTRQSEYETVCSFYDSAIGVWMDEFYSDWITNAIVEGHINNDKKVCIVSPELHGRDPVEKWKQYRDLTGLNNSDNITLCTDVPEFAKEFIYGKN